MIRDYYSIHDRATDSYRMPFAAESEAAAIRSTRAALISIPREALDLHVADLTLCYVGSFDDSTGSFLPSPIRVITPVSALAATLPEAKDGAQNK